MPGSVRQTDVVSVSPGNTGEVNRAPMPVIRGVAVTESATSARPAKP